MSPAAILTVLIFAALTIASVAIRLIQRSKGTDIEELKKRVKSWWIMASIFLALVLSGKTGAIVLFALISYLALKEYFTMIPIRIVDRRIIFWAYLAIIAQYFWAWSEWYGMFIIWIPVYIFLLLPFRQVFTGKTDGFLESTGKVQWGLMLFVFSISHMAYLYVLPPVDWMADDMHFLFFQDLIRPGALVIRTIEGMHLLLFLVVLTELNDVYQYIFGKRFGKRKIVPSVSPNKTTEGFLYAVAATSLTALALKFLTPFGTMEALFAGVLIATAGFVGDVVVSMIKRDVGVKDSGGMIPGHGGILDRIDSLTYTAPLFFHFVYYLYY